MSHNLGHRKRHVTIQLKNWHTISWRSSVRNDSVQDCVLLPQKNFENPPSFPSHVDHATTSNRKDISLSVQNAVHPLYSHNGYCKKRFQNSNRDKECTFLKSFYKLPCFSPRPGAENVLFHNLRVKSRHCKPQKIISFNEYVPISWNLV